MKKLINVILMFLTGFLIGCGNLNGPITEKVKGGEVVVDINAITMKAILQQLGLANSETAVYGYKAYKIPYHTMDEEGNSVEVSGLMVIPTGVPKIVTQLGYSMVSDDHGTIFKNSKAPSVVAKNTYLPSGSSVILTSLAGFATLQPDYIGFGDSKNHYHPFILKKSLANATVDFIKASKKFAVDNNITLNDQLFLTGYSEGGYATLATLQKIEEEGELTVTMAAPMAGPYAVETMAKIVLKNSTLSVPSFMANVGYAYAKTYYKKLDTIINAPYASKLETLFNGNLNRTQIDSELTKTTTGPTGLFKTDFVASVLTDPQQWFRVETRKNDVHNWAPSTAVRLVHCKGDNVIPYKISELTQGTMLAISGGSADVTLVPVEETLGLNKLIGHTKCGPLAYKVTAGIFAQVRAETIGY